MTRSKNQPGPAKRAPQRAYNFPGYDTKTKHNRGSAIDWMEDNDISSDTLRTAMRSVKRLQCFKDLTKIVPLDNAPAAEKNGTFTFGNYQFKIYANGQIRAMGGDRWYKISSPHPTIIPDKPIETLVATYTSAIKWLIAHQVIERNK